MELDAQLRQAIKEGKPTYIRIGKKGEPNLFNEEASLGIGKASLLEKGEKFLILSIGPLTGEALEARELLRSENIEVAVASMGSVKPLNHEFLAQCMSENYTHWISLEEHHKTGGLGSALLEWLSERGSKGIKLKRMGIEDNFIHELGTQSYVRENQGINAKGIAAFVRSL